METKKKIKSAFNLNLILITVFALCAALAHYTKTPLLTGFFTICAIVFLILLPNCSKTN